MRPLLCHLSYAAASGGRAENLQAYGTRVKQASADHVQAGRCPPAERRSSDRNVRVHKSRRLLCGNFYTVVPTLVRTFRPSPTVLSCPRHPGLLLALPALPRVSCSSSIGRLEMPLGCLGTRTWSALWPCAGWGSVDALRALCVALPVVRVFAAVLPFAAREL